MSEEKEIASSFYEVNEYDSLTNRVVRKRTWQSKSRKRCEAALTKVRI